MPVANQTIGLQEYGETNPSLIAGLEARGARVDRLQVYRWALPDDTTPLEANARRLAEGEADVVMLTSANQLNNLMMVAERLGIENAVREGFRNAVVVSIGPTTSERLRAMDLPVDIESTGAMGKMVADAAAGSHAILERKKGLRQLLGGEPATPLSRNSVVGVAARVNSGASSDHLRGRLVFVPLRLRASARDLRAQQKRS